MSDYPKQGVPMDTADHPDVQGSGTVLRPSSYNDGAGPQAGASDLMTAMSGNSHYNTKMENVKQNRGRGYPQGDQSGN